MCKVFVSTNNVIVPLDDGKYVINPDFIDSNQQLRPEAQKILDDAHQVLMARLSVIETAKHSEFAKTGRKIDLTGSASGQQLGSGLNDKKTIEKGISNGDINVKPLWKDDGTVDSLQWVDDNGVWKLENADGTKKLPQDIEGWSNDILQPLIQPNQMSLSPVNVLIGGKTYHLGRSQTMIASDGTDTIMHGFVGLTLDDLDPEWVEEMKNSGNYEAINNMLEVYSINYWEKSIDILNDFRRNNQDIYNRLMTDPDFKEFIDLLFAGPRDATNSEELWKLMPIELKMHFQRNLFNRFNRTPQMGHAFLASAAYSTNNNIAWGFVGEVLEIAGVATVNKIVRENVQAALDDIRFIQTYDYHQVGSTQDSIGYMFQHGPWSRSSFDNSRQILESESISFVRALDHKLDGMKSKIGHHQFATQRQTSMHNVWNSRTLNNDYLVKELEAIRYTLASSPSTAEEKAEALERLLDLLPSAEGMESQTQNLQQICSKTTIFGTFL